MPRSMMTGSAHKKPPDWGKKNKKNKKNKIKYVQVVTEFIPQMYYGLSGETEVWIIERAECYISYESWLSSVAWNYESVDNGRFIPNWVLCQAQLSKCCSLWSQTSIIIRGAAGRVPSVPKCPFFMCQFRTRWEKHGTSACWCLLALSNSWVSGLSSGTNCPPQKRLFSS